MTGEAIMSRAPAIVNRADPGHSGLRPDLPREQNGFMPRFRPWGPDHCAALALTAMCAYGLAHVVRRAPARAAAWAVRLGLAAGLLGLAGFELLRGWREGWLRAADVLPLQLCDAALVLAVIALLLRNRTAALLLYFWAGAGTLLAMLTPDLPYGFPSADFVIFFGLHGLALTAAAVAVFGLDLVPARGAWWRAFLVTLAYAGVVALANLALDTNFMYLRAKPAQPTLLDHFGPWPLYLLAAAGLALLLFRLLDLPLAALRRSSPPSVVPPGNATPLTVHGPPGV
jgi:hypothetical integral membrane protein (TIGR02206 family)